MRSIPYFAQEDEHTCGQAVVHMVLAAFGIESNQIILEQKMLPSRDIGTNTLVMANTLKEHGLIVSVKSPGSMRDAEEALHKDAIVIVCYTEPSTEVGHYAIMNEITGANISLIDPDPDHGPNFKMPREEFERRWRDPLFTKTDHWLAIVSAEQSA